LFSLIGLLLRWRDTPARSGRGSSRCGAWPDIIFAMLLVSEHGTGFGLLLLMLVLTGLPAFGAPALAGHIERALRS
jgi:hypothetical protein